MPSGDPGDRHHPPPRHGFCGFRSVRDRRRAPAGAATAAG